jgi:hypothetical protein
MSDTLNWLIFIYLGCIRIIEWQENAQYAGR